MYAVCAAVDASMAEQLQQYEVELKTRAESLSAAGGDKMTVTPMEVDDEVTVDEVFDVRPDTKTFCLPTQKNMANIAIF
jgi:hypothetical protein